MPQAGKFWSAAGEPVLTKAERAGLDDFLTVYFAQFDDVVRQTLADCEHSGFDHDQLLAQSRRSRDLLARAVESGEWEAWTDAMRNVGRGYADAGVSFSDWYALVRPFTAALIPLLGAAYRKDVKRHERALHGMSVFIAMARSVIGEGYVEACERRSEQALRDHEQAVRRLSTPVLRIRAGLLVVPLIGEMDARRVAQLQDQLLASIQSERAKAVVLDLTGVPEVDSHVAGHIVRMVDSARLLGACVVVTGIARSISETLAVLGVTLEKLSIAGDLQGGIELAEAHLRGGRGMVARV